MTVDDIESVQVLQQTINNRLTIISQRLTQELQGIMQQEIGG